MGQRPKSVSAIIGSATPTTIYTVPTGKSAIVNNVQGASLLGSNFCLTVNKVSNTGIVYPIAVNKLSGDYLCHFTTSCAAVTGPMTALTGSITLEEGESISASTITPASFKFEQYLTGNGKIGDVIYANGLYVAVGKNSDINKGLVLTSSNGTTWTPQTFSFNEDLQGVAYGNNNFVAINYVNGTVYVGNSTATTWTQVVTGMPVAAQFITYLNGTWFLLGPNVVYTATNPSGTWTELTSLTNYINGETVNFATASYDGTNYFFTSHTGGIIYTSNLTNYFSSYSHRSTATPVAVTYHPTTDTFFASFAGGICRACYPIASSNNAGRSWIAANTPAITPPCHTSLSSIASAQGGSNTIVGWGAACGAYMATNTCGVYGCNCRSPLLYSTNNGVTWVCGQTGCIASSCCGNANLRGSLCNGYYMVVNEVNFVYPYYDDGAGNVYFTMGTNYTVYSITCTPWTNSATSFIIFGCCTGCTPNPYNGVCITGAMTSTGANNGPWMGFVYEYCMGGPYGNACTAQRLGYISAANSTATPICCFSNTFVMPSYGCPTSATYWANTGKFYVATSMGYIFSFDSVNSPWTCVKHFPFGYNMSIAATSNNLIATFTECIGQCCTCGCTYGAAVCYSPEGVSWYSTTPNGIVSASSSGAPNRIAASNTTAMYFTYARQFVSTTTGGDSWSTTPVGVGYTCTVGSNTILQYRCRCTNSCPAFYRTGMYITTDVTSANAYTRVACGVLACYDGTNCYPSSIAYTNCSYLSFNAGTGLSTNLYSGISCTTVSSTSINGLCYISGPNAIAASGNGAVIAVARSTSGTYALGYTPDVNLTRTVAAVAASVLEIDNA